MILIHVSEVNNRVKYSLDLLFKDILRINYQSTTNIEEFKESNLPKFSYGKQRIGNFAFVSSAGILFENDIHKQHIEFNSWNNLPIFFETANADIPFDIFGASFFLISRYEEYLPHNRDSHNRFRHDESVAFKGGFLERPIINLWAVELKNFLLTKFPALQFPHPVFSFTPTIDIDNAFAYKHKGFVRITSSLLARLFSLEFKKFKNRLSVHAGYKKDPYDSYQTQFQIHKKYNVKPLYFILLGDYSKFDRNISPNNKSFIDLVKSLDKNGKIGIHPSYKSNKSEALLVKEKGRLEGIVNAPISRSRQHYIKLEIPCTYRNLIKIGVKEDYSMGYPTKTGFRASTCIPFYFFDVEENIQKDLKIYPFVAMDSTLKHYHKFRSKEVVSYLRPIVEEVKTVGGNFTFIFHNESIGNERNWKNWGDIYEKVIKLSLEDNK
jgi:hypothetical protein